ncbi:MAG: gephyrin-like molybdotransferase Glp [Gammaproteobacteria bacterium]
MNSPQAISFLKQSMLTVEQARTFIFAHITPPNCIEKLAIRSTLERFIAEDIKSTINVPSHTNSAMDGYAINGQDIPLKGEARLTVTGSVFAGQPLQQTIQAGQCARIMTGGMMPAGTDTVIMQEDVQRNSDTINIQAQHKAGQNVRQAGEDLAIGQVALHQGQKIMPAELGILASLGIAEIRVWRRLRVAFFSTGNELRSIGDVLADGEVYDSNRYSLYGMLSRLGIEIIDMGVIPDQPTAIRHAFESAAENADVIISSGGVSVGEADFIKQTLNSMGEIKLWKIAMRPGCPLAFGKVKNAFFFGLPGNPVAVMVTFYQFVQDALLLMSGAEQKPRLRLQLPTTSNIKKRPGRTEFIRGIISSDSDGNMSVTSTGQQGSGILNSMSRANCFIVLGHDDGPVSKADMVLVEPFDGFI